MRCTTKSETSCRCPQLNCVCGERPDTLLEWTWDKERRTPSAAVSECGTNVEFHPVLSTGTAIATGSSSLTSGYHHFWEVKLTKPVYGTDIMIGITTQEFEFSGSRNMFSSLLGKDDESWGFSYQGYTQHADIRQKYACKGSENLGSQRASDAVWSIGSIVGAHLDTFRGTLEFYVNRRPLGVAFSGLKGKTLYPAVCSTAAKSEMKLICAQSFRSTLQFDCIKLLSKAIKSHRDKGHSKIPPLYLPPGLVKSINTNYWFFFMASQQNRDDVVLADDSFDSVLRRRSDTSGSVDALALSPASVSLAARWKRKMELESETSEDDDDYFFGECDINRLRTIKKELMKKNCDRKSTRSQTRSTKNDGVNTLTLDNSESESVSSSLNNNSSLNCSVPCGSQDFYMKGASQSPAELSESLSEQDNIPQHNQQGGARKKFVLGPQKR